MAYKKIKSQTMTALADALRTYNGTTAKYTGRQVIDQVKALTDIPNSSYIAFNSYKSIVVKLDASTKGYYLNLNFRRNGFGTTTITWGDGSSNTVGTYSETASGVPLYETNSYKHQYTNAGTYIVTVTSTCSGISLKDFPYLTSS